MSVVPMVFPIELFTNLGVLVAIYHADGSVAISHGGVEIGQGVNTKVNDHTFFYLTFSSNVNVFLKELF